MLLPSREHRLPPVSMACGAEHFNRKAAIGERSGHLPPVTASAAACSSCEAADVATRRAGLAPKPAPAAAPLSAAASHSCGGTAPTGLSAAGERVEDGVGAGEGEEVGGQKNVSWLAAEGRCEGRPHARA